MAKKRKPGRPKGSKNISTIEKELAAAIARARGIDESEFKGPRGRPRLYPVGYKKSTGRKRGRPKGSTNKPKNSSGYSGTSGQRVIIVGRIKLK